MFISIYFALIPISVFKSWSEEETKLYVQAIHNTRITE